MKDYVRYELESAWFNMVWTQAVMNELNQENEAASWDYVTAVNKMAHKNFKVLKSRRPDLAKDDALIISTYEDGISHAKRCLKANDVILEPLTA